MKKLLAYVLTTAFLVIAAVTLSPATPAQAATGTQCGAAYCTVDTSIRAESKWREQIAESISGSDGSLGSGTVDITRKIYTKACDTWLPVGGGTSTHSYPTDPAYSCNFTDGGHYGSGKGALVYQCAPRSDRAANGRITVYQVDPVTGEEIYGYYLCLYPTNAYAPVERNVGQGEIATGGKGDMVLVNDPNSASVFSSTGTITDSTGYISRGVSLSNPEAYVGTWTVPFSARTGINDSGLPKYGYYSLKMAIDYRVCVKWAYPSWIGVPPRYDCSQQGQHQTVSAYTYGCNLNPALSAGIVPGALFIPSQCAPAWQCVVDGSLLVNGYPDDITIMRNGERLTVTNPTYSVTGGQISNARSWAVKNTVTPDATPETTFVTQTWQWDTWGSWKKDGHSIAFNWASDSTAKPFSWNQKARFSADFWVPTQASISEGTVYKWVPSAAECPQVIQSPKISVIRATSG